MNLRQFIFFIVLGYCVFMHFFLLAVYLLGFQLTWSWKTHFQNNPVTNEWDIKNSSLTFVFHSPSTYVNGILSVYWLHCSLQEICAFCNIYAVSIYSVWWGLRKSLCVWLYRQFRQGCAINLVCIFVCGFVSINAGKLMVRFWWNLLCV